MPLHMQCFGIFLSAFLSILLKNMRSDIATWNTHTPIVSAHYNDDSNHKIIHRIHCRCWVDTPHDRSQKNASYPII